MGLFVKKKGWNVPENMLALVGSELDGPFMVLAVASSSV